MPSFRQRRRLIASRVVHAAWRRMQAAGTVTWDTSQGQRFAAFGTGSLIAFPTGSIYGEQWIEIGDRTMLGEQVTVCAGIAPGQDLGPEPVLRIGDGCIIGRGSHIVAHCSIDIGDDVYTGPYVYITDQNHGYSDPDVPVGRQWPVNSAVSIGAGTWLGTGVIVLPGAVIGRNVVVAAGSVVRGEIADHCVVAGVPARVVKDYSPETGWARPGAAHAATTLSVVPALASVAAAAEPGPGQPRLAEIALAHLPQTESAAGTQSAAEAQLAVATQSAAATQPEPPA
jgi:acetyltransferase-like isoleucine patch superfamily enzyme